MANYYDVLEIHQEVSIEEIKQSFRTLIKKYHPDLHVINKHWAESKTKVIIQAYKTLSDATSREQYDRLHKTHKQTKRTHVSHEAEVTETASSDVKSRIRVIFTHLLDGQTRKATEKYQFLLKDYATNDPLLHLNHKDYVDCKFLLAEAYEKSGEYESAILLYEATLDSIQKNGHRSHLSKEIKERLRTIYCRKLVKKATHRKALEYCERALKLGLPKQENAFIYKKMAECYTGLEEYDNALQYLNKALSLKPNIQGTLKLKTKLSRYTSNTVE